MTAETMPSPRRSPSWVIPAVAGVFGFFYAYAAWNAIGFLISQASGTAGLNGAGWALLLFAVVFPIVVFVAGVVAARRRPVWKLALVLLTGLGLVAVFWLNVLAYAFSNGDTLLGS
ncbi:MULTISPECIES: hypothetical protein [unclassified Microbacterium]|uniref:hypothetical protein n=1 Tax=unclassified Microbacterium TaxID=2609290 RepID=UPI00386A6A46